MKIAVFDVTDFEVPVLNRLKAEGNDELVFYAESLTEDACYGLAGFQGVSVLGYSKVNKEILSALKKLGIEHVSTRTIGFDHIDVKAAKEMGIHVYHAFYSPNNVADFTVMMMLIMLRKAKISICRALVNDFSLDGMMGRELRSLTVGVIGTGKIGATVVKNLSGFGCRIIAYDFVENPAIKEMAEYVDLDTLYEESDIITLHVPLTEDNYHMINDDTIAKMKKGVILINTARGQLIDTESLIRALENEYVGGAGIDTLEEESGVMHVDVGTRIIDKRSLLYLKQFPNVLYTQHYAFYTKEATESMVRCGIEAIRDGVMGKGTMCEV